jgi:hypothetical protein
LASVQAKTVGDGGGLHPDGDAGLGQQVGDVHADGDLLELRCLRRGGAIELASGPEREQANQWALAGSATR